jgi:hypothetical protein
MKYIKAYENNDEDIAYSVGDIVTRITLSNAEVEKDEESTVGEKFIVQEIYTYIIKETKHGSLSRVKFHVQYITYKQIKSNQYYTIAQNFKKQTNTASNLAERFVNEKDWTIYKYNL